MKIAFILALICLGDVSCSLAADWPMFRGPDGNGTSTGAPHPEAWDTSTNMVWTVDIPGNGWSAPIVIDGKVFITTAVPTEEPTDPEQLAIHQFKLHCYDLSTGELLWDKVALEAKPNEPKHRDNTFASETPVTDGKHIFAHFGMNGLYCYDLAGNLVWEKALEHFPMRNDWGTSSGPVFHEGSLFLQIDNEQNSHLLAIDASNGQQLWQVERPDEESNWGTPFLWKNSIRTELILGGKSVRSYDPKSGHELWSMEIGSRGSSTPTALGDLLVVGCENRSRRGGSPGGLFAVAPGASGQIDALSGQVDSQPHLVWANLRGAIGIASPLVTEEYIYVFGRRGGRMRVHRTDNGQIEHQKRLPGGGPVWSSPWTSDGKIYCLDERGTTFVLAPGEEIEVVAQNSLPGRFWSTPALSDGSLLLRSEEKLYCVRAVGTN